MAGTGYDYIICGGGPAGCAIAARLSEDASVRVLLLEAGGRDSHPYFRMPAGFAKMTKGIASWGWSTVPQKHLNDRVLWYTQAKVLGGGWTTPKGTGAVPLRLHDGKIVLAWARRPDELRAALQALLAA